ncbi:hypothetical protein GCM10009117_22090 [Gangjinia marincola]|uniref:Lipocalin-like domain-containing protein n=1 Tax=Gangjinia marincola TaxID=578463 RepID=A0ABN1MIS5_9FLAO
MQKYLIALTLLISLFSCAEEIEEPYRLPKNPEQLLASDSTKTWKIARRFNDKTRMNMGYCFMRYRQEFSVEGKVSDNNNESNECGESLVATWKILTNSNQQSYLRLSSDQIPALFNQEKNFKDFKILKLTKDSLTLSFRHKQYGDTYRTITDYLVREDLDIGDRNFHW